MHQAERVEHSRRTLYEGEGHRVVGWKDRFQSDAFNQSFSQAVTFVDK